MEKQPLLIDKSLKKIDFFFRYAGILLRSGPKTRKDIVKTRIVFLLNCLWAYIDIIGGEAWFFIGLASSKTFTELTYSLPCNLFSFLATFKAYYLIVNEGNVGKLIDNLKQLEIKERTRTRHEERDAIMKQEYDFVTKVISVVNVLFAVLLGGFAISPVLLVSLKYFTSNSNDEIELLLPFLIYYPFFNAYDIRYWPWVYLHQVWSETVVAFYFCSADYLFYTFCTYLRMQFRLLKLSIERLIPDDVDSLQSRNIEEIKTEFKCLVKWHQDLISSANILETIYTRLTLLTFISSSVLICLTGFNVTVIGDVVLVVTFLGFLFTSLLQVFFLCYFGDIFLESSGEISDAVYNCRWYLVDASLRKDLLLVLLRAQSPCKLTADNFAKVNLRAFMKILSTAWSYFALLQTMYGSPA